MQLHTYVVTAFGHIAGTVSLETDDFKNDDFLNWRDIFEKIWKQNLINFVIILYNSENNQHILT